MAVVGDKAGCVAAAVRFIFGTTVVWHVRWQPSGFFGAKFNLHRDEQERFVDAIRAPNSCKAGRTLSAQPRRLPDAPFLRCHVPRFHSEALGSR